MQTKKLNTIDLSNKSISLVLYLTKKLDMLYENNSIDKIEKLLYFIQSRNLWQYWDPIIEDKFAVDNEKIVVLLKFKEFYRVYWTNYDTIIDRLKKWFWRDIVNKLDVRRYLKTWEINHVDYVVNEIWSKNDKFLRSLAYKCYEIKDQIKIYRNNLRDKRMAIIKEDSMKRENNWIIEKIKKSKQNWRYIFDCFY